MRRKICLYVALAILIPAGVCFAEPSSKTYPNLPRLDVTVRGVCKRFFSKNRQIRASKIDRACEARVKLPLSQSPNPEGLTVSLYSQLIPNPDMAVIQMITTESAGELNARGEAVLRFRIQARVRKSLYAQVLFGVDPIKLGVINPNLR